MSMMCVAEFALWAVLAFVFWKRNLFSRFPAMGRYLVLRLAAMPVLLFFFTALNRHWFSGYASDLYFYCYWAVYSASALMLYFICQEVFCSVLSAFSGLQRLGIMAFRWAALTSAILSLSTLSMQSTHYQMIIHTAYWLMRSVSILELCLLAFLCMSMSALRLGFRNMAFGISLGFGMISSSDFILSSFWSRSTTSTDLLQFITQSMILFSLGIWILYAALPEPARKPVVLPAHSTILRWNEIASALGHTGTQVAVQPSGGFALTDVESAIESVLNRKLKNRESET
jgi:hypothetical protein